MVGGECSNCGYDRMMIDACPNCGSVYGDTKFLGSGGDTEFYEGDFWLNWRLEKSQDIQDILLDVLGYMESLPDFKRVVKERDE